MMSAFHKCKRVGIIILSCLTIISSMAGCGQIPPSQASQTTEIPSYSLSAEGFGTILSITLYGKDETMLSNWILEAFDEIERLEHIFSAKLPDSELSKVNEQAFEKPVEVSAELFFLFEIGLSYGEKTDGALDISIGQLVDLWGVGTDHEKVPTSDELEEYIGMEGFRSILLNKENQTVSYTDSRLKVDFGAIAKGYAADQVKNLLLSKSSDICGILNFGGNIMTLNSKIDGSNWVVGITDPKDPSNACASIDVCDLCVVTSGNYERYFEQGGVRYHHILDPHTATPSNSGIISSTIIGTSSTDCDALSTSCYVLGVEKALSLIESMDGYEAVFITDEGNYYFTKGIDSLAFQYL